MSQGQINLAVAGLGGWGKNVVRSFSTAKNCNLKAICDLNPDLLAQRAALYPQAAPTTDYAGVLADESIDAVAIATPAPAHYDMAKAALLAGKHVYVEKPMTMQADQAEELVGIADDRKQKLMVGHLLEYHPAVQKVKEQIDAGTLGDIYYMYCQRLNLGVVRHQENVFWSLAPHDISVILYLFGMEPSEIVASGQCFLQRGIEDVVFVNLYFPSGQMAQIHVSWLDPHKKREMVIVGSQKMLVFDDMHPTEKVRVCDKGACLSETNGQTPQGVHVRHGDIFIPHVPAAEPLAIETQHFVDAIIHDTKPRSDGHDGLRVVKILEEVDRQMRSVVPIERPLLDRPPLKVYAA